MAHYGASFVYVTNLETEIKDKDAVHAVLQDLYDAETRRLETELRDTKRALELRCLASFDPLSKPVDYWLEQARKEREENL
jgi:phage host-nuclease inhibitor protein Gam